MDYSATYTHLYQAPLSKQGFQEYLDLLRRTSVKVANKYKENNPEALKNIKNKYSYDYKVNIDVWTYVLSQQKRIAKNLSPQIKEKHKLPTSLQHLLIENLIQQQNEYNNLILKFIKLYNEQVNS